MTFLSFAINILMLITWNAKASLEDYNKFEASNTSVNETFNWALVHEYVFLRHSIEFWKFWPF